MQLKELYLKVKTYFASKINSIMLSIVIIGIIMVLINSMLENYENVFSTFFKVLILGMMVGSLIIHIYRVYKEQANYQLFGFLLDFKNYALQITLVSSVISIIVTILGLLLNNTSGEMLISIILTIFYFFLILLILTFSLVAYLAITIDKRVGLTPIKYSLNYIKLNLLSMLKIILRYLWIPLSLMLISLVVYFMTSYSLVDQIINNPELYYILERNTITFLTVTLGILIIFVNRFSYLLGAIAIHFDENSQTILSDW